MALQANARGPQTTDPIRNFRFLVKFEPLFRGANDWKQEATIGFTSVSGLAISTEPIPYREGGFNTTIHQIPGQTTFSPVTFQRGVVIGSRQHWDWTRMLFRTIQGGVGMTGEQLYANKSSFRANVTIDVLNHPVPYSTAQPTSYGNNVLETTNAQDDLVVARFNLYNAWPSSLAYSDLNAGDNSLMVEQMTLVHEGMSMAWASVNGVEGGSGI